MICVICVREDRAVEHGQVCPPCRTHLARMLADIARLYAQLDVMPGAGRGDPKITGSREAPLPLSVDVLDMMLAGRVGNLSAIGKWLAQYGDQIGHQSAATTLDSWVRDWCDARGQGEHLPDPTVPKLAKWLGNRLDWACDEHPAIDEFATEIRALRATLRNLAGETKPKPDLLLAPCRKCDLQALARHPGERYPIRCGNCGLLYGDDEYAQWAGLYGEAKKREKERDEADATHAA